MAYRDDLAAYLATLGWGVVGTDIIVTPDPADLPALPANLIGLCRTPRGVSANEDFSTKAPVGNGTLTLHRTTIHVRGINFSVASNNFSQIFADLNYRHNVTLNLNPWLIMFLEGERDEPIIRSNGRAIYRAHLTAWIDAWYL